MAIEIKVPSPGESITEVMLASWLVDDGSFVEKDQEIAEIDSDKATLSISAEVSGKISFAAKEGDTIAVGTVIGTIEAGEAEATNKTDDTSSQQDESKKNTQPQAAATKQSEKSVVASPQATDKSSVSADAMLNLSPLAKKMMEQEGIDAAALVDFFKHYRVGTKDVRFFKEHQHEVTPIAGKDTTPTKPGSRNSERKKMSPLRKKLSERLVSVKNETAMLTTFNEVNMTPIMQIRQQYKETFKQKHDIGLGFMSFFTKAVTEALKEFPQVNSQIDGDEIVTFDYADISIAVSGPKGLVVPVVRNAENLSLAEIEKKIKELAIKARDNKLTLDEMTGGTFTITNGGVFGSMLSTPIINPPQSAILGMHNIVERPIAVNGKVEIHPIMYVALSYDHRIIDGRESVSFLVKVKEMLENPTKMLFGSKDPVEVLLGL